MARSLTTTLTNEYIDLFSRMSIRPERATDVAAVARRITVAKNRAQYAAVEAQTGVPWFVVGIIHNLECSGAFDRHLHNGDPLTDRTVHVPRGRPPTGDPPFKWVDSAIDALAGRGVAKWADWSLPGVAFQLENYNGWGYRNNYPFVRSPYLWSFSNIYDRGKYVADGVFSPDAVSRQCGGLPLLSRLMQDVQEIKARLAFEDEDPTDRGSCVDSPFPADGEHPWSASVPLFPGRYLLSGLRHDPDVIVVQQRLAELRCDPGVVDGTYADSTRLAIMLFQARSVDLSDEPLEIDGVVGPKTWGALFGPDSINLETHGQTSKTAAPGVLGRAALEVADDEIGVMEVPPGSNRGRRVEEYQASVGPYCIGQAWCMCFVYWAFQQAAASLGVQSPVPRTGGVLDAWAESRKRGAPIQTLSPEEAKADPSRIEPGMVFFIRTSDRTGHAGLIVANFNGLLETIEGNTNNGGYRDGVGVFRRRRRRFDQINLGFASFG